MSKICGECINFDHSLSKCNKLQDDNIRATDTVLHCSFYELRPPTELYIYEVRDQFEQILSYWDKEDDALLASEFEDCPTEVIVRRLNPFEVVSESRFKSDMETLENKGVPKSVIAEALGITRPTLNKWLSREPRLKPSQMVSLNYLILAFFR